MNSGAMDQNRVGTNTLPQNPGMIEVGEPQIGTDVTAATTKNGGVDQCVRAKQNDKPGHAGVCQNLKHSGKW